MVSRNWCIGAVLFAVVFVSSTPELSAQRRRSRSIEDIFNQRQPSSANPRIEQLKTQADQAYQKGDYQRTVQLANHVLRQKPDDHVALYLRASANIEIGIRNRDAKLIRKSVADARNAIGLDSGRNAYYYIPYLYGMTNLAIIENKKQHAEVALKVADQTLQLPRLGNTERGQLYYQRGRTHAYLGHTDDAVSDFENALRMTSNHLGAYIGIADVYVAAGQMDKASDAFSRTVRAFPENPLVYNNRGMFRQHRGKHAEAVQDFTRAIELDNKYYFAYTNRGFALMESGKYQAAEADFSESLRIQANQPMVLNLRGAARLAQGRVQEAIADQQQVVDASPNDPVARADFGFALFFAGENRRALDSFSEAGKMNERMRHLDPWRVLAMENLGETESAKSIVEASNNKDPQERDWVDHLLVYLGGGMTEDDLLAKVNSTDKLAREAQLCEAHYFIGMRKRTADNAAASEQFEKALATNASYLSAYRGAQFALNRFRTADAEASAVNVAPRLP